MTRILVPELTVHDGGKITVRWERGIAPLQPGDQVLMSVELFERCVEILNEHPA